MAKKYVCMSSADNFVTTSETEARQHLVNNPDHKIAAVDDDSGPETEASEIMIEEKE
jgi:hypothetical protein